MEIILLQDVKSVGKKGEVVKLSDGYARNFILPKKLGVEATTKNLNELKVQKAAEEKRTRQILEEAQAFGKEIESKTVILKIKTGEGGRAFGSVSTKEVSAACKEQLGYDIDKKKMQLTDPIKSVGEFRIPVKLHPQVTVELKVKVTELP